jgi:hypothetical protein
MESKEELAEAFRQYAAEREAAGEGSVKPDVMAKVTPDTLHLLLIVAEAASAWGVVQNTAVAMTLSRTKTVEEAAEICKVNDLGRKLHDHLGALVHEHSRKHQTDPQDNGLGNAMYLLLVMSMVHALGETLREIVTNIKAKSNN